MLNADFQSDRESYINHVLRVHEFLQRQTDLSPRNPAINEQLFSFVTATMQPREDREIESILNTPCIAKITPSLRAMLGRAEYEMEHYCARAMVGKIPDAQTRYSSYPHFIYQQNYEVLIDSELTALKWHQKRPPLKQETESIAFVGAGPLPISAIMLCQKSGYNVTCVDSDEDACRLGTELIRHLARTYPGFEGLDKKVGYIHVAGADHDYVTHPIVFIASLVGDKTPVMMQIVRTTHVAATMVVRTAKGLSGLLYQPETIARGMEEYNLYLSGESKLCPGAINTSLILKYPPGKNFLRNKTGLPLADASAGIMAIKPKPKNLFHTAAKDAII